MVRPDSEGEGVPTRGLGPGTSPHIYQQAIGKMAGALPSPETRGEGHLPGGYARCPQTQESFTCQHVAAVAHPSGN